LVCSHCAAGTFLSGIEIFHCRAAGVLRVMMYYFFTAEMAVIVNYGVNFSYFHCRTGRFF
jgi:hypothetical protein